MSDFEKRKFLWMVVGIAFLILIVFEFVDWDKQGENTLEISYLDVGQGDATLISYLGRYQVLIDGGPSGRVLLEELGKQMPVMDKEIEIVILTHPDLDHLAGLIDVVKNYKVGTFLDNGQTADTDIFRELETVLQEEEIQRGVLVENSKISIGKYLNFQTFNPDKTVKVDKARNDQSIALRMDFGINSFLFIGDATQKSEKDMIEDSEDIDVDWLKIGHHGSKHSSSTEFLKATSPRFAVISVGEKNRYKHPDIEVLERVDAERIQLFRTDELGTIEVVCRILNEECNLRGAK